MLIPEVGMYEGQENVLLLAFRLFSNPPSLGGENNCFCTLFK